MRTSLRLVRAEFLKLRKRRGLVLSALVLTVVPMLVAYTVLLSLEGPAGGMENFEPTMAVLGLLSVVTAILVGTTLGTGDVGAGVFRELVVTGRSRLALFAACPPASGSCSPLSAPPSRSRRRRRPCSRDRWR